MIIAYKLVQVTPSREPKEVTRALEEGWQPYGSLVGVNGRSGNTWVQPMVKYSSDTENTK